MRDRSDLLPGITFRPGPLTIRRGRIHRAGAALHDIAIDADGIIAAIRPSASATSPVDTKAGDEIDVAGALVTPAFVDCHQHLDKARSLPFTPNPSGTLLGAIQSFGRFAKTATPEDIRARAAATIAQCLRQGTTALRSHVNVDPDSGLRGIEALAALREDLRGTMTLQLVTFLTSGAAKDLDWLRENAMAGAAYGDAIGGTPAIAADRAGYLDCLFRTAAETGLPLDLHHDEHLNPSDQLFDMVLDRVERFGLQGRTVLGHCSVLSALEKDAFNRICDRLLACDVSVVTLPAANLYLQGRDAERLPPRGLTRVRELLEAGVNVATASDNINDPFVPIGSGDMAETGRWTLVAAQLLAEDLPRVFSMATRNAARFMMLDGFAEIAIGRPANLVISDADDAADLIARGSSRRMVISQGRLVVPA